MDQKTLLRFHLYDSSLKQNSDKLVEKLIPNFEKYINMYVEATSRIKVSLIESKMDNPSHLNFSIALDHKQTIKVSHFSRFLQAVKLDCTTDLITTHPYHTQMDKFEVNVSCILLID